MISVIFFRLSLQYGSGLKGKLRAGNLDALIAPAIDTDLTIKQINQ